MNSNFQINGLCRKGAINTIAMTEKRGEHNSTTQPYAARFTAKLKGCCNEKWP